VLPDRRPLTEQPCPIRRTLPRPAAAAAALACQAATQRIGVPKREPRRPARDTASGLLAKALHELDIAPRQAGPPVDRLGHWARIICSKCKVPWSKCAFGHRAEGDGRDDHKLKGISLGGEEKKRGWELVGKQLVNQVVPNVEGAQCHEAEQIFNHSDAIRCKTQELQTQESEQLIGCIKNRSPC
jgi:hypothetical protein